MRTTISLLAFLAVIALAGCKSEPKPAPPPEQPPATEEKGTSIKAGDDGVEIESRDADVKISSDSASIELPPK